MRLLAFLASLFALSMHAAETPNLAAIPYKDIEGKDTTLASTKGKAFLVVNVASECGYTGQYAALEALYRKHKAAGLVVVGFPCNDFGGQEPGAEPQIKKFCSDRFQVTFPLAAKVSISGKSPHPLFAALTGKAAGLPGAVSWNFNKFVIAADGKLLARFDSSVEPDAPEIAAVLAKALK